MNHDEQNENRKEGNFCVTGSPDPQGRPCGTDLCTAGQCELSMHGSVRLCTHGPQDAVGPVTHGGIGNTSENVLIMPNCHFLILVK